MMTENEDKLVQSLMEKSLVEMPFSDFEDRLMEQIRKEEITSRSFWRSIKLSWLFFMIGTCLGIYITTFLYQPNAVIMGIPVRQIILIIQVIFTILILTQFDKLIQLARERKEN